MLEFGEEHMQILPDTHVMPHISNPHISRAHAPDLVETAQKFEAAILAELLRAAGAEQARTPFGGGIGEDQFASLLLNAQAQRIAAAGGIGLAEMAIRGLLGPSGVDRGGA